MWHWKYKNTYTVFTYNDLTYSEWGRVCELVSLYMGALQKIIEKHCLLY